MARGQTLPQEMRRRGDIDQQAIATDSLRDRPREEENVGRDGQPMISLGSVLQRQGGAIGLPIVSAVAVQRLMSFTKTGTFQPAAAPCQEGAGPDRHMLPRSLHHPLEICR
jgi:hypothetical protein